MYDPKNVIMNLRNSEIKTEITPNLDLPLHEKCKKNGAKSNKVVPEKLFPCKSCGKKFQRRENLKSHELLHTGEGFFCEYCEVKFTRQEHLQNHYRSHTGEKPFSCQYCEKNIQGKRAYVIMKGSIQEKSHFHAPIVREDFIDKTD